jgi:uncharacterized damage-inducible protein DinB
MVRQLPSISIPDETGPVVQTLMRLFRRQHERFWSAVAPLTVAQLDWQPTPEADAIGTILDHVITVERLLLDLVSGREPPGPPGDSPAYRVGRTGGGRSGIDAGAYLAELGAQYERGMAWLAQLPDGPLQEGRLRRWDGRETTIEREIEHMLDHLAYHRGQIVSMTLLEGFPTAPSSSA